jgi:type IX secretion system PorP/SprF family membrane protein
MKKILTAFLLVFALRGYAQQDPAFSHYWTNATIINPAQTAVNGNTTLNLTGRYQWIGLKGAPQTHTLSFVTKQAEGVGLGGSYVFDQVGPMISNTLNIDVAYHMQLSDGWYASAGARLSTMFTQVNLTTLNTGQQNDPVFSQNLSSGFRPNVGFGFLLRHDRFYLGFGQPRAIAYDLSTSNQFNSRIVTHRYLYSGYNFSLPNDFEIRPSLLIKQVGSVPVQADINLVGEYKQRFSGGFSYRTGDGIGLMLGFAATQDERLRLYYCYDYPLSEISMASRQTHQFTIAYDFIAKDRTGAMKYFD